MYNPASKNVMPTQKRPCGSQAPIIPALGQLRWGSHWLEAT